MVRSLIKSTRGRCNYVTVFKADIGKYYRTVQLHEAPIPDEVREARAHALVSAVEMGDAGSRSSGKAWR